MRRALRILGPVMLAVALGLASSAAAAAAPRMTRADRTAISNLIDRFIKDAVLRQNLPEAWNLAGPDLRGGTTRKAWVNGTGVTVEAFPARGHDFRNAWTGHLVSPTDAQLTVVLNPKPGSGYDQAAASVDVRKIGGRWLVDIFYTAAVFRSGKGKHGSCGTASCAVSGPNDYGPAGGGSALGNSGSRIGARWLWIGLAGVGALVVAVPLGVFVRIKLRDRRAWAAYSDVRRPSS
jgi:hypothetical protein